MNKLLYISLSLSLAFLIACDGQQRNKTLRLAHGLDPEHPVHLAMVKMGEFLEEKSGGTVKLQIYTNSQLGGERECLELLQIGSLDMTKVSANTMENFVPQYKAFTLPYIFRDEAHRFAVLEGAVGKEVLAKGDDFYLRGLCYYDAGSRSFYTKEKPVQSPEDLKGLKIRVMKGQTAQKMVSSLGGTPTPMDFGELYTALQQGVVDGAENNPPSFLNSKHYEVCKHYTIDEHASVPDVLVLGTSTWEKLNDEERVWLQEAAEASVDYQKQLWKEKVDIAMEEVQKAGVKIYYPEKSPFADKVEEMHGKEALGEELYDLVQRIKATTTE